MSTNTKAIGYHSQTDHETASTDKSLFGFWVYIMTDCILFASLFVTYIVLQGNTNGGPTASELFSLPFVLTETIILLTSSFTAGLAVLALFHNKKRQLVTWLVITLMLGASFLGMELYEFNHMVQEGHDWQVSGFLSGYFALVGMHGLHIAAGLLWGMALIAYVLIRGITQIVTKRVMLWSLFWHFLDIVWIFIFTFVYLMGAA